MTDFQALSVSSAAFLRVCERERERESCFLGGVAAVVGGSGRVFLFFCFSQSRAVGLQSVITMPKFTTLESNCRITLFRGTDFDDARRIFCVHAWSAKLTHEAIHGFDGKFRMRETVKAQFFTVRSRPGPLCRAISISQWHKHPRSRADAGRHSITF